MDENNNLEQNNLDQSGVQPSVSEQPASAGGAFDIPEKKKKKSAAPWIAAGLVVVCTGVGVAAVKTMSPEANVKAEVTKNYTDFVSRESIYSQIKNESLEEIIADGEYTAEGSIKLGENTGEEKLKGLGLGFSNVMSYEQKKTSLDMMADYNGVDLVRIMISCDEKNTRLHIPALFSESFIVENENVLGQLAKSQALGSYAQSVLDENGDMSIEPFAMAEANKAMYALKKIAADRWSSALKEAGSALTYENGEKVTLPDGKEGKSYIITWPADKAKATVKNFLSDIKTSAEYGTALTAQINYMFATKPDDMSKKYGSKEEAMAKFSDEFDDMIKKVEEAKTDDIKIIAVPTQNGMTFNIDQSINDTPVKIDVEYDRETNVLKLDTEVENDGKKTVINYNDSINTTDGVISENRSLTAESEGDKIVFTNTAQFNKADGIVDGSAEIEIDNDTVKADYKGTVVKGDDKTQISDASVTISNGVDSFELNGEWTVKKRDEDPREINSSSEIKLSELDIMQAMKLYNEAKDNLSAIQNILDQ